MRGLYLFLGIGATLLVLVHFIAPLLDFNQPPLDALARGSHTGSSILIRIASVPLRIGLVWALLIRLRATNLSVKVESSDLNTVLSIWASLALFYCLDILLNSPLPYLPLLMLMAGAVGLAALLFGLLIPRMMGLTGVVLSTLLGLAIHGAERLGSANNAFTIFGLQGIALAVAWYKPGWSARNLAFVYMAPAFGYLFPLAEKLLLNPIGWLSGQTLGNYAGLYGYTLSVWASFFISMALLLFQASFLGILWRPALGRWLYPIAILFHLAAGLVLGFGAALNPWIVSLMVAWAVGEAFGLNFDGTK